MRGARFRVLTIVAACGAAAALAPAMATASTAVSGPGPLVALKADAPPPVPHGAIRLGTLAARSAVHLDVTLRLPNPAAVKSYITNLTDTRSPLFHKYLRPGQFGALFGPTRAQVATVESALRAEGLRPGKVSANHLLIPVTAPAAAVAKAFGTTLVRYRLAGGRVAYSNTAAPRVPASAAPYVQGVVGLSNLYRMHTHLAHLAKPAGRHGQLAARPGLTPAAAGPQPCADATTAAQAAGSFTADQLASHYAMTPLYQRGDLGQGVRIALLELEPNSTTDIAAYAACYGVTTSVTYTQVDGGAGTGAGSGEAALDIEDVMGLAPNAAIDVYQGPNTSTGLLDLYSKIVTDDDKVVSTSWGLCELDSDPSVIQAEQNLFFQAATQGQTVLAAAGDSGSTDCLGDGTAHAASLAVDDPASQPSVTGVGGTSIGSSETTWNDSALTEGAGGGGISAVWCMPGYQHQTTIPGLINSHSKKAAACGTANPYIRQVPDVAADADPQTGYTIFLSGSWQGGWGGTSAAAPLWAAVAALIDASPFCSAYGTGPVGAYSSALYRMAAARHAYIYSGTVPEGVHDVTSGDNHYTPPTHTAGLYPATAGYDMTTGLGTPLVAGFSGRTTVSWYEPGLAALMCGTFRTKLKTTTITKVSPARGPATRATTVTITGTGFLPIAGADVAIVGSRRLTASCTTTTRCTVRLPATKPSTVSIRMSVETFTLSAVTSASHFQYVAAPTVSSLSPTRGTHRGGTRVTIRGTNFIGVTAVHFGSKRGTSIRVVSSTEILVTAPAGSGTVAVTVTAAGGTSKVTTATHYRYT